MAVFDDIMVKLEAALKTIKMSNGYETTVKKVITYGADMSQLHNYPVIAVLSMGENRIEVEDTNDIRFSRDIEIRAAVESGKSDKVKTALVNLSDDIKKMIMAPVDLGTTCLGIFFEGADMTILDTQGFDHQRWRVLYVDASMKGGSAAGTDVYGSNDVYHDAINKIYDQLNTLKTSMASLDPTFSYLYKNHRSADLRLNAVSLGIAPSDSEYLTMSTAEAVGVHTINISIRVHTAYAGGQMDEGSNMRLLNSMETHLYNNVWLGDNFVIEYIAGIDPAVTFDDSATLGGEMTVSIKRVGGYTQ